MKLKKLDYLIKLTYDKTYNGYVADVVNLCGCMSQGKTKKEALENIEKAIKAFMEAMNLKQDKGVAAPKKNKSMDTTLLSEKTLGTDWGKPEEDEAWAHLQ